MQVIEDKKCKLCKLNLLLFLTWLLSCMVSTNHETKFACISWAVQSQSDFIIMYAK